MKKFRQFHNNSEHMAGHYKFWICENPAIAKMIGIDTERPTGDVYMLREANKHFNDTKANCNIFGYQFSSERLMTGE